MKALAILTLLVGCASDLPATLSFQQDVAPILAANCGRCHGGPTIGGAPDDMRVTYPIASARRMLLQMRVEAREMPPRWELEADQIEIISRWATQADPRGEPRPGNQPPEFDVTPLAPGQYAYTLYDPDGDLVGGSFYARDVNSDVETDLGYLHQGRDVFTLDPSLLMPGGYLLVARFDDGAGESVFEVGMVRVP